LILRTIQNKNAKIHPSVAQQSHFKDPPLSTPLLKEVWPYWVTQFDLFLLKNVSSVNLKIDF
jgi:hypothetical protein